MKFSKNEAALADTTKAQTVYKNYLQRFYASLYRRNDNWAKGVLDHAVFRSQVTVVPLQLIKLSAYGPFTGGITMHNGLKKAGKG